MNSMVRNPLTLAVLILLVLLSPRAVVAQGPPSIIWQQHQNSDRINSVIFSPDGQTLISGSSDRLINFWRTSDGALLQVLNSGAAKVHESSIEWLAINNDASRLVSASYKVVKLWRLPAGTEQPLTGHTDWVVGVASSPDGTYFASASFDGTVKVWRASDGSLVKTLPKVNSEVRGVSFSPDGQFLASAAGDAAIRIYQTSDWTLKKTLTGHTSDIYVLTFSPDGTSLASGGYDHTARVWNTSTWTNRYTINAAGNVYALAFTRDNQQLALSDGEANHIQIHRVSTGALVKRFDQQVNNVQSIAFSSAGMMGYGKADGTVVLANWSGTAPTPPPTNTPPPVVTPPKTNPPPPTTVSSRLNILFQNGGGVIYANAMRGTNRLSSFAINNGRGGGAVWRVYGLGDFNGDGQSDYIWQNPGGATSMWLMQGGFMNSGTPIRDGNRLEPRWRVAGVGDFNHDGKPDILFQTGTGLLRAWLMNGIMVTDTVLLLSGERLTPGWRVTGIGDFNHDGNSDLILQNAKGLIEIQLMNGLETLGSDPVSNGLPLAKNWRVAGVADFDGDGELDILLQHSTGYMAVWFMHGTDFIKSVYLNDGKKINPGWRIIGVAQ